MNLESLLNLKCENLVWSSPTNDPGKLYADGIRSSFCIKANDEDFENPNEYLWTVYVDGSDIVQAKYNFQVIHLANGMLRCNQINEMDFKIELSKILDWAKV